METVCKFCQKTERGLRMCWALHNRGKTVVHDGPLCSFRSWWTSPREPESSDLHLNLFIGVRAHVREGNVLFPLLRITNGSTRRHSPGARLLGSRSGRFHGFASTNSPASGLGPASARTTTGRRRTGDIPASEFVVRWKVRFPQAGAGSRAARNRCG